jgi:hypothetical protein
VAEVGDTVVGVTKVRNAQVAPYHATNQASDAATVFIELPTTEHHPKEKTMSDQQDRKLQHTDEQKPVSEQKSGNQPNQPMQQKQENPSGQPKSPQSEQEKHDQEKKKQA